MSNLTAFHKIGRCREKPRIWLESKRLEAAGFQPGAAFSVVPFAEGLRIVLGGTRNVSSRKQAGTIRPIIELFGSQVETAFRGIETIKARSSWGQIEIRPSIRAAAILRAREHTGPWNAVELFAGGGTLSDAVSRAPQLRMIAGAELEPAYADVWAHKHPEAELITGDIRLIHPAEIPRMDVLIAGIPCTAHSTMGRAKNKLANRPEEGECGDLFAWVLNIVAHHCPTSCVFENVPSFGTSLAGSILKTGLRHLGYHLHETVVSPHHEWGEPSERKRWVLVATLSPGFSIQVPENPTTFNACDCLDMPDEILDEKDAQRIAKTIVGLRAHNARHAAKGNGFSFTTINRESKIIPTIAKSYHKINTGPFVETPYGPRLLRLHEVEAIMGASAGTQDYSTGIQILGQGVQTRLWANVFQQLGKFLENPEAYADATADTPESPAACAVPMEPTASEEAPAPDIQAMVNTRAGIPVQTQMELL